MVQTKEDIVAAIEDRVALKPKDAKLALKAVLDFITESLEDGDTVQIMGFGSFSVTERASRTGRNPQTGETIEIPARNSVKFKPGSNLRQAVN